MNRWSFVASMMAYQWQGVSTILWLTLRRVLQASRASFTRVCTHSFAPSSTSAWRHQHLLFHFTSACQSSLLDSRHSSSPEYSLPANIDIAQHPAEKPSIRIVDRDMEHRIQQLELRITEQERANVALRDDIKSLKDIQNGDRK